VLHQTISAVPAQTWEAINRTVLASARKQKVEAGDVIGLDSTVTAALMHEPSDSSLLWDAVRVIARLLKAAERFGAKVAWRDHRRAAKRRARAIQYTRGRPRRVAQYRELIKITCAMLAYLQAAASRLDLAARPLAEVWRAALAHYRPLIERIIDQTERRVLRGEVVAAQEKIVSLFEPHADIIVKGGRDTQDGHKLNLVAGRSGLILDLVIETGNPADCERLLPMLERHAAFWGRAPRQAAADGGYANIHNQQTAKARGLRDMAFHKKAGLRVEDMVRSRWVYRKLRNFRAGIEAGISCLKRAYGLGRCTWRGTAHFQAYVWSSVVAYNLALMTRLRPA
jgi:IS5 family transposase